MSTDEPDRYREATLISRTIAWALSLNEALPMRSRMILGEAAGIVAGSFARSSASARSAESFAGTARQEGDSRLAGRPGQGMSQSEPATCLALTQTSRGVAIAISSRRG